MSSYHWIKLYHEVLDDPKMARLPDSLWRRTVEAFLLAGRAEAGGLLPPLADMAWSLRITPEALEADLTILATHSVVEMRAGRWFVSHFAKRQAKETGAERMARQRERQRKRAYYGTETTELRSSDDSVTYRHTELDIDREERRGEGGHGADAPAPRPPAPPPDAPVPSEHPAVVVFHELTGRWPAKLARDSIRARVGYMPEELDFWREVVGAWVLAGWNKSNVGGMLECYGRHEIPGTQRPNGKGPAEPRGMPAVREFFANLEAGVYDQPEQSAPDA